MKKLYLLPLLILGLISCQRNRQTSVPSQTEPTPSTLETTSTQAKSKTGTIYVNDTTNTEIARINLSDKPVIYYGEKHIYAKIGSSGKRKYITDNNGFIAKINTKADGFKLKTEAGSLLWKVKIKPEKIKVANNEEMENAFEAKYKHDDLLVIAKNDEKEGQALYTGSFCKVVNASETFLLISPNSYAAGVLAMKEIPLELRLVIMAEIMLTDK